MHRRLVPLRRTTARLNAASDRVMSLLHAAMNIERMIGQFYASLSDQQRRRFNAMR